MNCVCYFEIKEMSKKLGDNYDSKDLIVPSDNATDSIKVTDRNTLNTCKQKDIIDTINIIDFHQARLSREFMDKKQVVKFIQYVEDYFVHGYDEKYDQDLDVNEINGYIRKLLYMLWRAMRSRSELAVGAAIFGIKSGIENIHKELSDNKKIYPENFGRYMENCRKYMNCFILLTTISARVDEVSSEVRSYKNRLDEKQKDFDDMSNELKQKSLSDKKLLSDIKKFENQTYNDSSTLWSREMHEWYSDLLSLRIKRFNIKFERFRLESAQKELQRNAAVREQILSVLKRKPIPDDVDDVMQKMGETYADVLEQSILENNKFIKFLEQMRKMNNDMDDIYV